jgi:hypothetical protein
MRLVTTMCLSLGFSKMSHTRYALRKSGVRHTVTLTLNSQVRIWQVAAVAGPTNTKPKAQMRQAPPMKASSSGNCAYLMALALRCLATSAANPTLMAKHRQSMVAAKMPGALNQGV